MTASAPPPNQLLQLLDPPAFDLLRPHLATVELVRKSVLGEAGAALRHVYFPHAGSVSITVGLSDGQMIEIAMLGRDSVVGGGAALADGIALSERCRDDGSGHQLWAGMNAASENDRRGGHLVPIANISHGEHDGSCCAARDFGHRAFNRHGHGRQLWKRWCARPTGSCPHFRQTIMN